jgi:hypothetical protein
MSAAFEAVFRKGTDTHTKSLLLVVEGAGALLPIDLRTQLEIGQGNAYVVVMQRMLMELDE